MIAIETTVPFRIHVIYIWTKTKTIERINNLSLKKNSLLQSNNILRINGNFLFLDDRETIPDESSLKRRSVEEIEESEEKVENVEKEEKDEKDEKEETKESIDEMLKEEDETVENVENKKDEEYESETKKRRISDTEENCDT